MINPDTKKTYLKSLNESQLRQMVLLPLFRRMGIEDIKEYHGGGAEKGKDIVGRYKDPLGEFHYVGIVVKGTDIHGAVGKKGSASEVLFQVEQALNEPFTDVYSLDDVGIRECWVVTSGTIKNTAVESIRGKLGKTNLEKLTRFIDQDKLIGLIDRFWPEFWINDFMIQSLAHELMAPILSAKSRALFVAEHPATLDPEKVRSVARQIAAQMGHLQHLVETVATLYRDELALSKKRVDIRTLVVETATSLRTLYEGRRIDLAIDSRLVLMVDPWAFRQILWHLLQNALRFAPATEPTEVRGFRTAHQVVLQVKDWGIGVPEGWEELIFNVGVRAPNAVTVVAPAAGLGLFLARKLVELHQGEVRLTSRKDPTEFSIYLPLAETA